VNKAVRRRIFGLGKIVRYRIFNFILALIILAAFINVFSSIELMEKGNEVFKNKALYLIFQVILVVIGLGLIAVPGYLLHYGFGPISRMEKILEDVAFGNYSRRMSLREKDIMRPLAKKINRILDLLEKTTSSNQPLDL
jgi:signal transduction histidine kinase